MASEKNAVFKSGLWYTISNFLMRGIGFITTPIFTRLLTQEEYGAFTNYSSWLSILAIITSLNLEATIIRARHDYAKKLDEYILSVMSLGIVSTSVCWLIVNIFIEQSTKLFDMNSMYINSMFLYLLTVPAINLFQTRERYAYRYKVSVFLSMLLSVGGSFFSVLLVVFLSNRLTGRIVGLVVPNVVIGIVIIIYILKQGKRITTKYWKEALFIALPYIPHMLSLTILNMLDRIMITKICGKTETALYSLGYTIATVITILLTSLNGAFSPWLGDNLAKQEYSKIRKVSKGYIALFIYFAVGIMLLAPEILLVLGGKKYVEAKWVMIPIALGCVCQFIYTMFVNIEQFEKKTIGMAFASISAALLNFVLNAWFIPIYGYVAAAYTTFVGYLWLLIIHMFLVYRLKLNHVYSYKFIGVILTATFVVSILINGLYILNWARYIILAIYVIATMVIGWKNKDKLFGLIKR